jgi:hypothetical protein
VKVLRRVRRSTEMNQTRAIILAKEVDGRSPSHLELPDELMDQIERPFAPQSSLLIFVHLEESGHTVESDRDRGVTHQQFGEEILADQSNAMEQLIPIELREESTNHRGRDSREWPLSARFDECFHPEFYL